MFKLKGLKIVDGKMSSETSRQLKEQGVDLLSMVEKKYGAQLRIGTKKAKKIEVKAVEEVSIDEKMPIVEKKTKKKSTKSKSSKKKK